MLACYSEGSYTALVHEVIHCNVTLLQRGVVQPTSSVVVVASALPSLTSVIAA